MYQFVVIVFIAASVYADLLIDLPDGTVRGTEIKAENYSYYAYRGIPFATPPLGDLRFQAPVPNDKWEGVLNATATRSCCIPMSAGANGEDVSEDCLFINVFTPARNITEKLPVMFSIFGGGFSIGCGSDVIYGPYPLVNEDVIVVTANYRLGVFGFLSTQDSVILGNAGLKDQLLAMQWTQKNIEYFGGDPEKVTIFGESAGGMSVGVHIANKKSGGLYRAAICQSGCSLVNLTQTQPTSPRTAAYDIARSINPFFSASSTTEDVRDLLQSVSADALVQAFQTNPQTGPVIEVEDEDAYITDLSFGLLESGNFNQVPVIIGTNSAESLPFVALTRGMLLFMALLYDTTPSMVVPPNLGPLSSSDQDEVVSLIKKAYTGGLPFLTDLAGFIEYSTDVMFGKSSLKQAEVQSSYSPVYLYELSFTGNIEVLHPTVVEGAGKTGHGEDIFYLFDMQNFPLTSYEEFLTRSRMTRLWANFAKTLNPTPDPSDTLLNVTWSQVSGTIMPYLNINDTLQVKSGKKQKEMAMWDYVYYTYGQQPFRGF